jgi:hypothetical protein
MHRAARRLRPYESTTLEALRQETQSVAIPPKHLYTIAAPAAKDKELTRKRIFGELGLHKSRKTIEPVAQIRMAAREPYAGAIGQSDHRIAAKASRSIPASTIPRTRTKPLA